MAKSKEQSNEQSAESTPEDSLLTLREAAAYLGVTDQRVRTLLREGRIEATKNEKGYWRVSPEALDAYNATKGQRTMGGKSFVFRANPEEFAALQMFVAEQGYEIEFSPRYKYDPEKAKAYRLARAEKQAAEADAEASEAEA
jgi:excisionase family DNA binding protein